jgi:heavy metal sensor kinase
VKRLPIRVRVTLAFALVMALVLAAVGFFVRSQLESRLNESIDENLNQRAGQLSAVLGESGAGLSRAGADSLLEQEDTLAQVLEPGGEIVDSTAQLAGEPALDPAQLEGAAAGARYAERAALPGVEGRVRLLAAPVRVAGDAEDAEEAGEAEEREEASEDEELIVVVGASLEDRDEALAGLTRLLLIGGPIALLLASLAGYGVAAAALRPVEAMRGRAAAISAGDPGERLPVPPADDELSRLGHTLNAMLGRLEDALARERRFVDDAAHELRTPLALHKTELELALRYGADEEELRRAITSSVVEVDRLIQLAEDLLVVARAEDGELRLSREDLNVAGLLGGVAERYRARAQEQGRRIAVDADPDLSVRGDRLRLEQALTNMVDNALRHGDGEVTLSAIASGEDVELHVRDEGRGFDPGYLPRAFERFSRADEARSGDGVGLGLSIVETIARAHGGTATAANTAGGGADVAIGLPD